MPFNEGPWTARKSDNDIWALHDREGRHFANLRFINDKPELEEGTVELVRNTTDMLRALAYCRSVLDAIHAHDDATRALNQAGLAGHAAHAVEWTTKLLGRCQGDIKVPLSPLEQQLLGAAQALLKDWDSPDLNDTTPIAERFDALREAVAKASEKNLSEKPSLTPLEQQLLGALRAYHARATGIDGPSYDEMMAAQAVIEAAEKRL